MQISHISDICHLWFSIKFKSSFIRFPWPKTFCRLFPVFKLKISMCFISVCIIIVRILNVLKRNGWSHRLLIHCLNYSNENVCVITLSVCSGFSVFSFACQSLFSQITSCILQHVQQLDLSHLHPFEWNACMAKKHNVSEEFSRLAFSGILVRTFILVATCLLHISFIWAKCWRYGILYRMDLLFFMLQLHLRIRILNTHTHTHTMKNIERNEQRNDLTHCCLHNVLVFSISPSRSLDGFL